MQTDSYAKEAEDWKRRHALVSLTEVQAFFDTFKAETDKPHVGDRFKEFVRAMLLRAQEAGLYSPQ